MHAEMAGLRVYIRQEGYMRARIVTLMRSSKRFLSSGVSEYDVVVIGGGPAGYVASIKAAQLGMKAACIEGRGTLGGTCLNVGCIPSKSLLHNSHLYHMAKTEFKKRGIELTGLSVNLPQMIKAKEQSVSMLTAGISGLFRKNKVDWIKGWGKITSDNTVEAKDTKTGDVKVLKAKNIIIATGSESVMFPGVEVDEKTIVSSTGALSLDAIPEKMTVLGGGIIGLELGSVWSRLGSNVTVIEYLDSIGGSIMDSAVSKSLSNLLKKQGLTIKTGTKATAFKKSADGKIIMETETVSTGKKSEEISDVLLISVGRRPFTKNLGLENVGIKLSPGGQINVDEHFVTSVSSIRAIGDVIRGPMLAHKAEEEGLAVIEHIQTGCMEVNYDVIPSVIYTHPEVAWVGKTEEQVVNSKIEYKTGTFPFIANSRAKTIDDADGFVKVISQKSDDKILGIHIIGPSAGELIGEAALALGYGASSEDIARTCHAHPTFSEALKEACMATCDKPIHF